MHTEIGFLKSKERSCHCCAKEHKYTYMSTMNQIKLRICKEILREVCYNFDAGEEFINNKIEEICSLEKLSFEEVTFFVYVAVSFFLELKKVVVCYEIKESIRFSLHSEYFFFEVCQDLRVKLAMFIKISR